MKNKSEDNKNLFWYGFGAKVKRVFGIMSILVGICLVTIHWILFLGFLALGIYLIATGSSERFDYKMKSGTIVHLGDR